ncbi:hypothetical protein QVD17_30778 [Tagetes erecta]|uniref:Uncharacterized protein n=1 Tax=Tagetes erecta TaxID=13708 RepID=A0AAD8NMJ9_TARER|nr:hypothetical protein QVD17_30778 [Tagetes erecta]
MFAQPLSTTQRRPHANIVLCRLFVFSKTFHSKTYAQPLPGADLDQPLLRSSKIADVQSTSSSADVVHRLQTF